MTNGCSIPLQGHADLVIWVLDNGKYYNLDVSGFKVKDAKHLYVFLFESIYIC